MLKELLKKIRQLISEYKYFLVVLLITLLLSSIQFPYFIQKDGGTINVQNRIEIEQPYPVSGTFKMAYVAELKATIPTLFIAWLNHWEIEPLSKQTSSNETIKESEFRNKLLLNEANQSAIIAAYKSAGKQLHIAEVKHFISYIDPLAKTTLKIGDQLLQIEGKEITSLEDIKNLLDNYQIGDTITVNIKRDDTIIEEQAEVISYQGSKMIGLMLTSDYAIQENISFQFKNSESGPSGGLIMALAIYNYITPYDITKGKNIVGTGTIDSMGNIGEISGVTYKLKSAVKDKADIFLVPLGKNYNEAIRVQEEKGYSIDIIGVSTLQEAIDYLKKSS